MKSQGSHEVAAAARGLKPYPFEMLHSLCEPAVTRRQAVRGR
jgi:hypothetical protein